MNDRESLARFLKAQEAAFPAALAEIRRGRKTSHWMWYIFPQVQGLGFSETSRYYAIRGIEEAEAYFEHQVLGPRLLEICNALLQLPTSDAHAIFGSPDDLKLRSSMTLFSCIKNGSPVFRSVLDKFFNGAMDSKTLAIIGRSP